MTNSKRIVEISVPVIRWKFVLLAFSIGALSTFCIYWWKEIRPYFKTEKATLHTATLQIYAAESGKIESYPFDEGERFLQGQLLLSLNEGLLSLRSKQMDLEIKTCKERLEWEKERLDQTMQLFVQTQNEIELGIASPNAFDAVLAEVQEAQQNGAELEQQLSCLQSERNNFQNKIEQLSTPAPFEGIVLRRFKQTGEFANAGDPILLICNSKERWVETAIPETLLGSIHIGSDSVIEFSSFPGKRWKGSISWISPIVENELVKVRLRAENLPLQPGLSAKAKIRIH